MVDKLGETINNYFAAKAAIHTAFGWRDTWREISLEDMRGQHWMLTGERAGSKCVVSDNPFTEESIEAGKDVSSSEICDPYRGADRAVFRSGDYVLVCVDTNADSNLFLYVLDAGMECTDETLRAIYQENW